METTPITTQSLPAGTRIKEFVIERVLGSGGFGMTYLARDTSLDRHVVIKENLPVQFCFRDPSSLTVAPRHTHGDDVENFRWSLENFSKEAAMLASLDHPGIVKVLRRFEAFGTAYFVMPFVEGVAFDELITQRHSDGKPFTEEELHGLLERTLSALDHLHQRGIYHRDIKPGNILITNEGVPVLIDFGSARQRISELSMTVIESPGYTPFEQLQSRGNIGPWSDLYALGGTLCKAITGEAPPKANDRAFDDPFVPLSERPELITTYSASFLRCLDRSLGMKPTDRWLDAGEWLAALRGENSYNPNEDAPKQKTDVAPASPKAAVVVSAEKKLDPVPWGIAACLVLGLFALPKKISDDKEERQRLLEEPQERILGSKAGEERKFEIAPGVNMTFCWIPPGDFLMGSPEGDAGRDHDETQHRVKISEGFWLAKTETTQAQWRAVMGSNPSRFKGDALPVEQVSLNDIAGPGGFIEKVNENSPGNGNRFSLPTEAQWEYACRAGTTGAYSGDLEQMAWYGTNSVGRTHAVGQKKPNAWGLHDMLGNVWEWCADWYGAYSRKDVVDPLDANSGPGRVIRGGSWSSYASYCRVADRNNRYPVDNDNHMGFRLARYSSAR